MNRNPTSLAKITRPDYSGALPRERLFSLLDQGRDHSIIWVSGPPGSGKTTLLSNYIDNRKPDCLWYQVDQGENDIATFFYYIRQAAFKGMPGNDPIPVQEKDLNSPSFLSDNYLYKLIQKITNIASQQREETSVEDKNPGKFLPKFSPEHLGNVSTFTKIYFRHLFEQLNIPFIVVFDGYDEVPAHSEFHEILRHGLSEIPQCGCVVFISRTEPLASMARFRANQTMQIIGWNELRLTQNESDGIVKLRGLELSNVTLLQLYNKTQGWAAGLVLMLEHYRAEGKISRPPETFTPQVIFDYLAGEIFHKLDNQTKEFLLQTACLPQMTAVMAEEITGYSNSGIVLNELSRHQNFVTAKQILDKTIYQYHPLFREFLLSLNKKTSKTRESVTHYHNAAKLLELNGQVEDAVELLTEVEEWDLLANLVQRHASEMIENGRRETLAQWLDDIPEETSDKNPWILYWLATCRFPFALRESRHLYERAYDLFKESGKEETEGLMNACASAIKTILYEMDDFTLLDPWIKRLGDLLHNSDLLDENIEARITSNLAMSMLFRQPDNPEINHWLDHAYSSSLTDADLNHRMLIQVYVSMGYMWTGLFSKAWEIIDSMNKLVLSPEILPHELIMLKNAESMYFMFMGERDCCLKAMHEGLKISRISGVTVWNYQLMINGVGGALGSGDLDIAEQLLKQIETGQDKGRRQERCLFYYFSAWNDMLHDEKLTAYQHQKIALQIAVEVGNPIYEVLCRLAIAHILFECGDERKGAVQLRKARHTARNIKNHLLEYISFLSYGYIAIDHGRKRSGLKSLEYAMQLGREFGYMHTLWWRPEVIAKLCAVSLQGNIETEYVQNLIRKHELASFTPSHGVEQWPWLYRIYTLGQCKLLKDEHVFGFATKLQRKPMELLKAIIAFGGNDVSEDNLAKTLWPGVDSDYSHRSLTTTIHRLRKLLGRDEAIIVQEGRISLNEKHWWMDTWAFEEGVEELDNLLKSTDDHIDTEIIMQYTDKILQLYRGPFMTSENDQSWFVSPREQFRNKFLRCMSQIAYIWEERGNLEKAVDCYQKSLEADNLVEGFYQRLMLCYRKMGKRTEAIEVYERCKKVLSAVLRIEPSKETNMLYEKILHDPYQ